MTRVIEPTKGRVLVRLGVSAFGDIPVPPKDHDSLMEGIILKVNSSDEKEFGSWIGKTGHWRKYMDDLRVAQTSDGGNLALIDIEHVMGISWEE